MSTTVFAVALVLGALTMASVADANPPKTTVHRNVRWYGAVGDGVTDDTAAFIAALTEGKATLREPGIWSNSQYGCQTTKPSHVYVPAGTYLISATLPLTYYTQLVGEYHNRPVLRFVGASYTALDAGIDEGGHGWYPGANQDNFFHQVRNLVVDVTGCTACIAIHWQVSQATNIVNTELNLCSSCVGIRMENGSGGALSDIVINGGQVGMAIGNQQFTFRNVTINGTATAVDVFWNWIMVFSDFRIIQCPVGFRLEAGVTSASFVDLYADGVGTLLNILVSTSNVLLDGLTVGTKYGGVYGACVGSSSNAVASIATCTDSYARGTFFDPATNASRFVHGASPAVPALPPRPAGLLSLDGSGKYFGVTRPQYDPARVYNLSGIVLNGTDVTTALNSALALAAGNASGYDAVFLPYGLYYVTSTVVVPAGARLYGEAWSRIVATGPGFARASRPRPVLRVGNPGDVGVAQLADLLLTNEGPVPGAVMIQWNLQGAEPGAAGMWDVHWRIGGAVGTRQNPATCPIGAPLSGNPQCRGAHTLLHVTSTAGTLYMEGNWGWVADHDIDAGGQINMYSARGMRVDPGVSKLFLYGTAFEHSYLYQYNFVGVSDVLLGVAQTESPYYQPQFSLAQLSQPALNDPDFETVEAPDQRHAYSTVIRNPGSGFVVYGMGMYSFFRNWSTTCGGTNTCQRQLLRVTGEVAANGTAAVQLHHANTHGSIDALVWRVAGAANASIATQAATANGFCATVSRWG